MAKSKRPKAVRPEEREDVFQSDERLAALRRQLIGMTAEAEALVAGDGQVGSLADDAYDRAVSHLVDTDDALAKLRQLGGDTVMGRNRREASRRNQKLAVEARKAEAAKSARDAERRREFHAQLERLAHTVRDPQLRERKAVLAAAKNLEVTPRTIRRALSK